MLFVNQSIFRPAQDVRVFKLEDTFIYEADARDRLTK